MRDVELIPDSASLWYRYGLALYLADRYDDAEVALRKSCELDPRSYEGWMMLALLQEKQGDWDEAIQSLKKLDALHPNDPAVREVVERIRAAKRQAKE